MEGKIGGNRGNLGECEKVSFTISPNVKEYDYDL